jgi:hypothetical protein
MLQDRKYDFQNGKVINRASGEEVPEDEPVFVFRARDIEAIGMLRLYQKAATSEEHARAIGIRIQDFENFAEANPDRMKLPDTDTSDGNWETTDGD